MVDRQTYDVVILGGGAAGLMAALTAGARGLSVLVLELSNKLGKKILMSGGGRCNFTNLEVLPSHFLCSNPHFVKSALAQYSNWDFIALVAKHGIAYHEKEEGQLFCDHSAKDIVAMLVTECEAVGVEFMLDCETLSVGREATYLLDTNQGGFSASSLIVATGGLSIPTLGGASGLAYKLADQFGLEVTTREASLVPFTLSGKWLDTLAALSGVSLTVTVSVPAKSFTQSMLFTHRGLSGPAILQLSNFWYLGNDIEIDLLPSLDASDWLVSQKQQHPNKRCLASLQTVLPNALAETVLQEWLPNKLAEDLHSCKDAELRDLGHALNHWCIKPSGTEGYRTAEVTRGGISVEQISSKTMQVKHHPGLFFIGEALDVTGYLGGFNFQWAWSSGYVAGMNC